MFDPFLDELHSGIKARGAVPIEVPLAWSTINHPSAPARSKAGFGTFLDFVVGALQDWMLATASRC